MHRKNDPYYRVLSTQPPIQLLIFEVHEKVDIALIHLAKLVAEKYDYALPRIHMNEFNEKVKKLGEKVELDELDSLTYKMGKEVKEEVYKKYELLLSHVCRRSFATNMYMRGVEPDIIMTTTGHSNLKLSPIILRYPNSKKRLSSSIILLLAKERILSNKLQLHHFVK